MKSLDLDGLAPEVCRSRDHFPVAQHATAPARLKLSGTDLTGLALVSMQEVNIDASSQVTICERCGSCHPTPPSFCACRMRPQAGPSLCTVGVIVLFRAPPTPRQGEKKKILAANRHSDARLACRFHHLAYQPPGLTPRSALCLYRSASPICMQGMTSAVGFVPWLAY